MKEKVFEHIINLFWEFVKRLVAKSEKDSVENYSSKVKIKDNLETEIIGNEVERSSLNVSKNKSTLVENNKFS